jgi:hypothetical protein
MNLTPHPVTILDEGNNVIVEIPPVGVVARAIKRRKKMFNILVDQCVEYGEAEVPVNETEDVEVKYLPPPENNVFLIVSTRVYQAAGKRHDLFVVDESVRDDDNRTVGCRALARPL